MLGTGRVCATPRAEFGFHAGHIALLLLKVDIATQEMFQHYPPAIQAWVKEHHAMDRILPKTYLKPPELWKYVPRCPDSLKLSSGSLRATRLLRPRPPSWCLSKARRTSRSSVAMALKLEIRSRNKHVMRGPDCEAAARRSRELSLRQHEIDRVRVAGCGLVADLSLHQVQALRLQGPETRRGQIDPNLPERLRSFMADLEALDVESDFGQSSLVLRWRTGGDVKWNFGTIHTTGKLWTDIKSVTQDHELRTPPSEIHSALKAVRGYEIEEIRRAVHSPYQQDRDAYRDKQSSTGPEQVAEQVAPRVRVRRPGDVADIRRDWAI